MVERRAFVLLDDARNGGGADAHLFADPVQIFVAHRPEEVADILAAADTARIETQGHLAGYIAYEAGLALEPKLMPQASARSGAAGPLVWLGLFDTVQRMAPDAVDDWLAEHAQSGGAIGPLEPQISIGGYVQAFEKLQQAIRAGDIYQANLTFPLAGSYRGDPVGIYRALRPAAQAGYGGLIFDGSHWLLSLSPELFVASSGDKVRAKPMKGTRPRGRDTAQDNALKQELATSAKDKAENLMIVDLMRNDLSRIAVPGSVAVDAPFTVETYPTLHQMVTGIRATLAPDKGAADLIRAMFPCGSITGAPKIRAMELIGDIERDARGSYCGAIGRIGPPEDGENAREESARGEAAFNVAIRTLRLTPIENDRGTAVLGVGSAIVADSDTMTEWREAIVKGGFVRQSLVDQIPDLIPDHSAQNMAAQFDLIETMRFDPENGIELLPLHLERLRTSAAELGFSFDRHAARNQIHALCFALDRASRIRLLCARSGVISLSAVDLVEHATGAMDCIALPLPVDPGDWRLRHKTSDRGFYERARQVAQ
ncbi:MAG: aminodeoxychorismate synthase component I, partial [Pontixanthobacter sp.]